MIKSLVGSIYIRTPAPGGSLPWALATCPVCLYAFYPVRLCPCAWPGRPGRWPGSGGEGKGERGDPTHTRNRDNRKTHPEQVPPYPGRTGKGGNIGQQDRGPSRADGRGAGPGVPTLETGTQDNPNRDRIDRPSGAPRWSLLFWCRLSDKRQDARPPLRDGRSWHSDLCCVVVDTVPLHSGQWRG